MIDNKRMISRLQGEMDRAVSEGVFPGGVLAAALGEDVRMVCSGRLDYGAGSPPTSPDTVYDLASLTKILSTTYLTMILVDRGNASLDDPIERLCPYPVPPDKEGLTLRALLSHSAGFPAWRPYYETLAGASGEEVRAAYARAILSEPLAYPPGGGSVYSDLAFILAGLILEHLGRARQDELFDQCIARPLGLSGIGYRPDDRPDSGDTAVAPTEVVHRRGGLIRGRVHDDNAAALGGVAGHAGLFGSAEGVWAVFNSLRRAFRGEAGSGPVSSRVVRTFWRRAGRVDGSTWALGFDTPSPAGSSSGRFFSPESVGHLGYTGASLWYDPGRDATVILLTNRVHPSSDNTAIRAFRPHIHDRVMETLEK